MLREKKIFQLLILISTFLDFNSYSGVQNGEANHENASGDGAPRGDRGGDRGGRPRRYAGQRGQRRPRTSESGGKPAPSEKVNNFDN